MKHIGNEIDKLFERNPDIKEFSLAKHLGMTRQNLTYTKKKSSVDAQMLEKIAMFFQVPISYFFDEELSDQKKVEESIELYEVKIKEEEYLKERIKFLEKELTDKQEIIDMFKRGDIVLNNERKKELLGKSG